MIDLFVELTLSKDFQKIKLNIRYVIRYESDPNGAGSIIYLTCKVNHNDFITVQETPLEIAQRMVHEWDLKFEKTSKTPDPFAPALS